MPTALITGVTGQDGAYLSKLLLEQGYRVVGTHRRTASRNLWRLDDLGITDRVELAAMDLLEFSNILETINTVRPDEIYNLAAQSFVDVSFRQPIFTADVNGLGTLRLLEAIRLSNRPVRFYQASTSELFGLTTGASQNELTHFHPRSPYGVGKLAAHWATVNYREAYGLFSCAGILFNHESPLRGVEFVTRKITVGLAKLAVGGADVAPVALGNLDARRDWGYAQDFCRAIHAMVQAERPEDFVIATGRTTSVREFATFAATALGMSLVFEGQGLDEIGIDRATGRTVITVNKDFYRPAEVDYLSGDAKKAHCQLDWKPTVMVEELAAMMAVSDLQRIRAGQPIL